MLHRFPQLVTEKNDNVLQSATMPFARYKTAVTTDKRTNFITEHTLLFVLGGHKILHIGEHTHIAEAGHVMLMRRGIYTMSEFIPEGLNYEALLLFFTDEFLKKFLNDQGKLLPRRITGNSLKYQRKVAQAVKKARQMALLPYVTDLLK